MSLSRRMKIAARLRGWAETLAEWICPEIIGEDE